MKKIIAIILLSFLPVFSFALDNVDLCMSYLGKPVPRGFSRIDRTTYVNDDSNIILNVENGIVITSMIGITFEFTHEASRWLAEYYNYFENDDWEFVESYPDSDLYIKDEDAAMCIKPYRREDGLIVAMVLLTKIEYLD